MKVQCPNCKKIYHETTDKFNPDIQPNGSMVKLLDPWNKWGWDCFDEGGKSLGTTPAALMNCPGCAGALAPSGRLTLVPEEPKEEEFVCDICQKVCKSKAGLMAHKRSHKMSGAAKEGTTKGGQFHK